MDAFQARHLIRKVLVGIGALLLGTVVLGEGAPAGPKPLALVGGRIATQTDAGTVEGTVLVQDGTIRAVGPGVTVPADAERIDVTGLVITPGLIDARSTLWLQPAAARESASDGGLDVLDGIDPHEDDWKEVIRQGVTAVYVQPASSGTLGGRGALLRVGPADGVEALVLKADAGAQASLGMAAREAPQADTSNFPRRFGGDPSPDAGPAQPAAPTARGSNSLTRFAQYEQLKRTFEAVKRYDEEWKAYEEKAKKDPKAARPRRDPAKDFLRKTLSGAVPVRLEAHREDDVRNALRLADEFKLRLVLDGLSNPGAAAADLASRRVPQVLGPFVELEEIQADSAESTGGPAVRRGRGRPTTRQAPAAPAAPRAEKAAERPKAQPAAEGRWALGTFSDQPRGSRLLRVHAAAAVARGLAPERVLRAMTCDAAEILGVSDRLGTVAPGKQADLVVFAGDPLDPSVPVRLVLSNGKVVYKADVATVATQDPAPGSLAGLPARLPKKYGLRTERLLAEDGKFQPGVVLVDGGKVVGLGPVAPASGDTPVYDLGAAVLTPGLVAAHSQLGQAGAIDDPGEADAGQVRAADAYDPQHKGVRELLEGGFTSALYAPGPANVIAGTAGAVRLGAGQPVVGDVGVKFVLTGSSRGAGRGSPDAIEGPTGRSRGPTRYPGSLAGQVELIEQVLAGKEPPVELHVPPLVGQHLRHERRLQVTGLLQRKLVAYFETSSQAEVGAALQLIARFKLRGVLVGPEDVRPFLDEIKRLEVGIVARPTQPGDYDRTTRSLAEASAAGVPVAFGSASAEEMRIAMALAVNAGLPREAAWRGLTTAAAQMTGLPPTAGRLAVGTPADLVIWDGSPLDLRSRPLRVVVDGKVAYAAQ